MEIHLNKDKYNNFDRWPGWVTGQSAVGHARGQHLAGHQVQRGQYIL